MVKVYWTDRAGNKKSKKFESGNSIQLNLGALHVIEQSDRYEAKVIATFADKKWDCALVNDEELDGAQETNS